MANDAKHNKADDWVLATGETHSVEFVEIAFELADLDWNQFVKTDKKFKTKRGRPFTR